MTREEFIAFIEMMFPDNIKREITEAKLRDVSEKMANLCYDSQDIASSAAGTVQQPITPTSTAPTITNGYWAVTIPGTYTNFGNVVLPENNFGFIFKNGASFTIQSIEMPMAQANGIVEANNTEAVVGGEVFEKSLTKEVHLNTIIDRGVNLFDKSKVKDDRGIQAGTGNIILITENPNYIPSEISDYIYVEGGKTYVLSGDNRATAQVLFSIFRNPGERTNAIQYQAGSRVITVNESGWIVFYTRNNAGSTKEFIQFEQGNVATDYVPYHEPIVTEKIKEKYLPEIDLSIDNTLPDDRFSYTKKYNEIVQENERFTNTLKSLEEITTSNTGEISFTINSSTNQENVIVPIYLHYGSQIGDSNPRHIFLNKACKKDFSDVRFSDSQNNLLEIHKQSVTHAEMVFDSKLSYRVESLSNGDLLKSEADNKPIYKSSDNGATWTELMPLGQLIGIAPNDNIIYRISKELYVATASSNYVTRTLLMTNDYSDGLWSATAFVIDNQGACYVSSYQEAFDVKLYKSSDNGLTWSKLPLTSSAQHVHSLVYDNTDNTLYVNVDGDIDASSSRRAMTYFSKNNGASFQILNTPYVTDYGVIYANSTDKVYLESGEASIKNMPTLSFSSNLQNWEIKIDSTASGGYVKKLGNLLFFFQRAHFSNKYAKIYVSKDKGKTWEEFWTSPLINNATTMNATYHQGSFKELIDKNNEKFLVNASESSYRATMPIHRVYEGGDHAQAMYYVKVPKLVAGNNTFKVKFGYLVDSRKAEVTKPVKEISGLISHLPLNEYTHFYTEKISGNQTNLEGDFFWLNRPAERTNGWIFPFENKANSTALSPDKNKPIIIKNTNNSLNFDKDFSVNVWLKVEKPFIGDAAKNIFLFGRENGSLAFYKQRENRLVFVIGSTTITAYPFKADMDRVFYCVGISVSNNELKVYINGSLVDTRTYTYAANANYSDWAILGNVGLNSTLTKDYMTDFKLFNKVLTADEFQILYEGNKII